MRRRQPGTFTEINEGNPREVALSARVLPKIAAEIDRRRGKASRSEYINLLLAAGLNMTTGLHGFQLLPHLGPFVDISNAGSDTDGREPVNNEAKGNDDEESTADGGRDAARAGSRVV